jgi:uncharacterized protein
LNISGHIQSIIPALFRKIEPLDFFAEEINTPDGDFLELDWYNRGSKSLIILSHGLEGNSKRAYMLGMAKTFLESGYDCLLWNFRSCGSRMNNTKILYHSGATYDLETVVKYAASKGYETINLIGFSLGGNLTLKFLGEEQSETKGLITRAAVFSVPCHLSTSADEINKFQNRIYSARFLRSLKKKMKFKALQFPELEINTNALDSISSIRDFDQAYTAPLHGFAGADDYYSKNSSINFLSGISVPALIVNAVNDPFLSPECFPFEEVKNNSGLTMLTPKTGGHCGFMTYGWKCKAEELALNFIKGI